MKSSTSEPCFHCDLLLALLRMGQVLPGGKLCQTCPLSCKRQAGDTPKHGALLQQGCAALELGCFSSCIWRVCFEEEGEKGVFRCISSPFFPKEKSQTYLLVAGQDLVQGEAPADHHSCSFP